ncbi:SH3 and cysteine-rich domain-containing protein [Nematolebias whitei]|uniref:SH3 and cysteine-rich domain-containing protein n=1 Tax=Nematolebias whitei TaxID=451745 RepID=UPI001897BE73|nr:SH3 and cysteine-rich domain-containing protein [Nematolebias whitei]
MIPPANAVQEDSGDKEDERDQDETPKSPTTSSSQETKSTVRPEHHKRKLQRLKRSLSFKTKSIRSKSADNFFRNSSENKTELLSDVSSSTGHLCNIGMAPPHTTSLPIPPVPPAIPCAPPPTSRAQPRNPLQVDSAGHCFMEHIFKKPTFCDVCNHMIVGTTAKHVVFLAGNTAKHGLRCKACKMSLHHKCENGVGQQRCMGKLMEPVQRDALNFSTYVALYSFSSQQSHDLEMRAGDRILLVDDSNEDWWKGIIEDRIGYFPAAFAHQLQDGEQVFRCNRTFIGCKEQGQITLKEGQICVSSEGERGGFIRVANGKKRGYVPCDVLDII